VYIYTGNMVTGLTIVILIILLWAFDVSWTTFMICIAIAYFLVPVLEKTIRGNTYKRV